MSDNEKGMKELFTYVYECGHREIAYIHGQDKLPVNRRRLASFYQSAKDFGVDIPLEYIREAAYRDTVKTALRLLSYKPVFFDGIFTIQW